MLAMTAPGAGMAARAWGRVHLQTQHCGCHARDTHGRRAPGITMRVAILEPAPVHHGWFHLEIRTPHLGPSVLAARLRDAGHTATVYSEFVAPIPLPALSGYDAIGISANT